MGPEDLIENREFDTVVFSGVPKGPRPTALQHVQQFPHRSTASEQFTKLSPSEMQKEMKFCHTVLPHFFLHSLISHKLCHYNKNMHASLFSATSEVQSAK